PWTYLAFTRIEDLCRRHDAELAWRPILVGGIFTTGNPSVYEGRKKSDPRRPPHPERAWRPILVGGIFNTVNPSVYEGRQHPVPAKARYAAKDLRDWARFYGLELKFPPTVFPVNSVKALRGALVALEAGRIGPYSERVFRAYFG